MSGLSTASCLSSGRCSDFSLFCPAELDGVLPVVGSGVLISPSYVRQNSTASCLSSGAAFGESVLTDAPRHWTAVTREPCRLIRVEQRDFRYIWKKNKAALRDLVPLATQTTAESPVPSVRGVSWPVEDSRPEPASPTPKSSLRGRRLQSSSPQQVEDSRPEPAPVTPRSSLRGRRLQSSSPQQRRRQLPPSPCSLPPAATPPGDATTSADPDSSRSSHQLTPDTSYSQDLGLSRSSSADGNLPPYGQEPVPEDAGALPADVPALAETASVGSQQGAESEHRPESAVAEMEDVVAEDPRECGDGEASSASPPAQLLTPSPEEPVPAPRSPELPHALLAARPLVEEPCEELVGVGRTLRTMLLVRSPHMVRDRKHRLHTFRRCLVGSEMVDWMVQLSGGTRSRQQATAMWQVMLEQGLVSHVTREHPFRDKHLFYRFRDDVDVIGSMNPTSAEKRAAEQQLPTALALLQQRAPDALIRLILRKPPSQRTREDLETVYEELLHIKALSHLTSSVKRELAGVIVFESHIKAGTVLFQQGDAGQCWYIILRGSVNVVIRGKGTVTTLSEGDDFGNLALVNDAPRAATIVCRENSCFFLRVDKDDFNRILRDVEANTVRLKEHGNDVLVLEKLAEISAGAQHRYSVMAGTPLKMLEHLLETRFSEGSGELAVSDLFLDDFLLTHIVFFPYKRLTTALIDRYRACQEANPDAAHVLACKRGVLRFLHCWASTIGEPVLEELSGANSGFLQELYHLVEADATTYGPLFRDETHLMMDLMQIRETARQERHGFGVRKWKMASEGHRVTLFSGNSVDEEMADRARPMQPHDEMIFRVYCADHTFCTLKFPLSATAASIRRSAADKLGLSHDHLVLVHLNSSGERVPLRDEVTSVPTGLSLNGRLFVSPKDHLDALTPLVEQEGPAESSCFDLETFNTRHLAAVITQLDWEAFNKIHEYEILYHVSGRDQPGRTTANLDVFLSRFSEYQHWVTTEMCLCHNLARRVALLKKFIKLATACREMKNLNGFFAIAMGLSNSSVSRLTHTWEKLPAKLRKMFSAFEILIDPTRNHRAYRVYMADLLPPIIPFMPLLIKDMTFTHEGNRTMVEGLINFEKMHLLAQSMRTIRYCRSRPLEPDSEQPSRAESEIRRHLRSLYVIDSQKILNSLSLKLEGRRA